MLNLFPYTNLHNLNLDWILRKIKVAVFSVNGYAPDDDGNVQLPTVPTVSSVNGQQGDVTLDAADVGAIPDTVTVPTLTSQLVNDSGYITAAQAGAVTSVNGDIGDVVVTPASIGAALDYQAVPTGGNIDQALIKTANTDYSVGWHDVALRYGNATRFQGALLDIDISNYQTAGGYAFFLAVIDWVTFGDLSGLYFVSGIASGQYQSITPIFHGSHGPQGVTFNGTDKIRVTFYNNAGGYYAIMPCIKADDV